MTDANSSSETLAPLDSDEILSIRENLKATMDHDSGPPARGVPASLSTEVGELLAMLEKKVQRKSNL